MSEDYLIHYGVLGMKWGVRKKRVNSIKSISKKNKSVKDKISKNNKKTILKSLAKKYNKYADSLLTDKEREYGRLEDSYDYSKNADKKKNAAIEKRMREIESTANKKKSSNNSTDKLWDEYGRLEDSYDYSKNADKKKNAAIEKRMREIENLQKHK